MLDQPTIERLLTLEKLLESDADIDFPAANSKEQLDVRSVDGLEGFIIDINRRGQIKISKCTYQERYNVIEILLRLDIDGPTHENPDGVEVPCPHLHIYREGYADKWAHPIPTEFTNPTDLVLTLKEFLQYCRIQNIPPINRPLL
jgi:hypothetical protein